MNFINSILGFPLGWLMWLCYALFSIALGIPHSYLLTLIVFTLITKAIFFPLQIKQQKMSVKMAYYQPQIAEIQKKYANDREKMQEKMMEFQEKEGIGMTAGCLPMLIQFGLLFGVIDVVYKPLTHILHLDYFWQNNSIIHQFIAAVNGVTAGTFDPRSYYVQLDIIRELKNYQPGASAAIDAGVKVLGSQNLANIQTFADSMNLGSLDMSAVPYTFGQEFHWSWLLLIPLLAGVAALVTTILTQKMNPASQAQGNQGGGCMKVMLYIMPLMSLFIALTVPAGVGVYWIISNLASLLSTYVLQKMYNPEKYRAQLEAEQAARRAKEKKKHTIVVEETHTDQKSGEQVVEEKKVVLSNKEAERRIIAEARRRMAEKYGDELPEDDAEEEPKKK